MIRSAHISPCFKFRYTLLRAWDESKPVVLFIMLNPSTASAEMDDNTVRKIVKIATNLGFGSVRVVNLWDYRTVDPALLRTAGWPRSPECDDFIIQALVEADTVVCGWGMNARQRLDRVAEVRELIDLFARKPPMALRLSKDGTPWHPLYLPDDTQLVPMP